MQFFKMLRRGGWRPAGTTCWCPGRAAATRPSRATPGRRSVDNLTNCDSVVSGCEDSAGFASRPSGPGLAAHCHAPGPGPCPAAAAAAGCRRPLAYSRGFGRGRLYHVAYTRQTSALRGRGGGTRPQTHSLTRDLA